MLKRIYFSVENRKEQTRFLFNGLNLPLAKIQPEKAYIKEIYTYIHTPIYLSTNTTDCSSKCCCACFNSVTSEVCYQVSTWYSFLVLDIWWYSTMMVYGHMQDKIYKLKQYHLFDQMA